MIIVKNWTIVQNDGCPIEVSFKCLFHSFCVFILASYRKRSKSLLSQSNWSWCIVFGWIKSCLLHLKRWRSKKDLSSIWRWRMVYWFWQHQSNARRMLLKDENWTRKLKSIFSNNLTLGWRFVNQWVKQLQRLDKSITEVLWWLWTSRNKEKPYFLQRNWSLFQRS